MSIVKNNIVKKGKILISEPAINDDIFYNSVVFITKYSKELVVGFILNKPMNLVLGDLVPEIINFNIKIYKGGPVASDNLYFIHKIPHKINGSIHIIDNLYWGGDFKQVTELINSNKLKTNEIRFFLGYSGWGFDQLKNEVKLNSWMIDDLEFSIFNYEISKLWINCLKKKMDQYQIWMNAPKDISLN